MNSHAVSMSKLLVCGVLFSGLAFGGELRPFELRLPAHVRALPEGSDQPGNRPAFKFRGIKGWAWSPEQYLAEIPVMAAYRMNFLMNCYSSLWELGEHGKWVTDRPMNFWYKPLTEEKKRSFEEVVRACRRNGIQFCFSMNPNLKSDRPFDYKNPRDFDALWQHYAWMQGLGVKWFNIALDDIGTQIDAEGQARVLNEILRRLRARDPGAQLIFCPTWYAGTGDAGRETHATLGAGDTPGVRYIRTLARKLDPDIYLFWTGPEVRPLAIRRSDAEKFRALAQHRLFVWDNYPNNNQTPTLDLGPLTGRDPQLGEVVDGYISNPMGFENEANRIPLLTIADYTWNPRAYDPERSIGQAIVHLGSTAEQRVALRDLVELYPGRLWDGSTRGDWNSLRVRFRQAMDAGRKAEAAALLLRAEETSRRLAKAFPREFVPARNVLDADIQAMRASQQHASNSHPEGSRQ